MSTPLPSALADLTIAEAAGLLATGAVSPVELTDACLARIAAVDGEINAFITPTPERARRAARRAEAEIARAGTRGPLHGVPLALKDLFDTAGVRTTAGSRFFAHRVPEEDAAVVARLRRSGAVLLGTLNMHEWALGVTNDNPHYGACRNPWAPDRITGGSSGGSAAALAARLCLGSMGSDTGGSIRIPAALCGVVGLKPTRGRVSLRGVVPLSATLDHAGPMARTVRDVAILLQATAGFDARDPRAADVPVPDYLATLDAGVAGWRVALAGPGALAGVDADVLTATREAARALESLGAVVEEVDLPDLAEAARANGLVTTADAAAFHHRRLADDPGAFGADVLARLRSGAAHPIRHYVEARHLQAVRRRQDESLFREHGGAYDVLLTPTTPCPAPVRDGLDALAAARVLTRFTAPFNFTGLPALSVPAGTSSSMLPVGVQIVAAPWQETRVLRAGAALERALSRRE